MDYRKASPDRYPLLKEFARENRRNPTAAESVLWEHLRTLCVGTRFNRQYIIGDYIVDFASQREGLIIEVDGAYHAERQQQEDDAARERDLENMGFHVMRFSNEEVLYDIDNVLSQIESYFE
ncbi:MAG: endonuclease domain-containing protein [Bacteroidaceae bacterium]|nr:endonuclease domain-containing protein [Bacteroidaceae bacterium]